MKSQRALRLRQAGKHHAKTERQHRLRWYSLSQRIGIDIGRNLARAFERNCVPKHSTDGIQKPCCTMDYITGVHTWHGMIYLHGGVPKYVDIEDMWVKPVYESETS